MAETRKVILTCALTGSVHTPSFSPHLPITPDEIAAQGIAAVEAGAAILHLHARDPADGRPSVDPAVFEQFVPAIVDATDAIINISTGGGGRKSLEERIAAARELEPDLASLNMGTMNFGLWPMAESDREWKFEWERPSLANTKDLIFRNSFEDIEHIVAELAPLGVSFECECFDVSHLHNLAFLVDEGLLAPPLYIQFVFGVLGGIGAEIENLVHMRRMADHLFGDGYRWSAVGPGRHQMRFATMSAIMGGNVRVGLEDSIYIGPGQLAVSNAAQVERARGILEGLSLELASPREARELLGLRSKVHER